MVVGFRFTFAVSMVVIMLALLLGCSSGLDPWTTLPGQATHIYLHNEIQGNKVLNVRCRSKSDDIGWRKIAPGGTYELNFKSNFWGTTRWKCHIFWITDQMVHMSKADATLYDYSTDNSKCYRHRCFWAARNDGLLFHRKGPEDQGKIVYPWEQKTYPHTATAKAKSKAASLEQQQSTTTSDMTEEEEDDDNNNDDKDSSVSVNLYSAAESKSLLSQKANDSSSPDQ